VASAKTPEPLDDGARTAQVKQAVAAMADQAAGDHELFGDLMKLSLDLAADGQFGQALLVADEMIVVAKGRSGLRPRGRRNRGRGARVVGLARQAKEQIPEIRREAGTNS
jgi:hypothetical protein